jgi:hypothetical protein
MQTFLFILDKLPAICLEIINFIVSLIGFFFSYYGLLNIPFYIDKSLYKNIFAVNVFLFIIVFLISFAFIIFRKFYLINKKLNTFSYYISICLISCSLLGFITNVIIDTFIINNMYFYDKKAKINKDIELTSKQWKDTILVIIMILILYFGSIFLSLSDNLRINLKIDDSYYKYQLAIEEEINNEKNIQNNMGMNINNDNKINNISEKIDKKKFDVNNIDLPMAGSDNDLNKNLDQNEDNKI